MSLHDYSKDNQRTHASKDTAHAPVQKRAKAADRIQAKASRQSQSRSLVQRLGDGQSAADDVHSIAAGGFEGSGSSLPHGDRIQQAFGKHDVSTVQAYTGNTASAAAEQIGAQAYASGNQVAFSGTPDLHTAAHEAAHVVQQRAGVSLSGGVGQQGDSYEQHADAVADAVVQGKNAEALLDQHTGGGGSGVQRLSAVQLMGAGPAAVPEGLLPDGVDIEDLSDAQIAELSRNPKARQALEALDPDTRKQLEAEYGAIAAGPVQAKRKSGGTSLLDKVQFKADHPRGRKLQAKGNVQASGKSSGSNKSDSPEKLTPLAELKGLIAKGGSGAWTRFTELNDASLWKQLELAERSAFAGTLTHALVKSNLALLKTIFNDTPDAELATLTRLFEARYNVDVGGTLHPSKTAAQFDTAGLRRCWEILEPLPPAHVEGNAWLDHWTRYAGGGSGSGYYWSSKKESSLGYDSSKIDNKNKAADPGDPLYDVIRFNKVVRHEVGHAVDKKIGGSDTLCALDKNGAWDDHGIANTAFATKLVTASNGEINKWSDAGEKTKIIAALVDALNGSDLDTKLTAAGFNAEAITKINTDPAAKTASTSGPGKSPWYNADDGGVDVGGRYYQVSYGKTWVSYKKAARDKKVSTYQWRAPGEWFAEVYATYYEPDGDGNPGTILDGRDPDSKKWFDENVHNMA